MVDNLSKTEIGLLVAMKHLGNLDMPQGKTQKVSFKKLIDKRYVAPSYYQHDNYYLTDKGREVARKMWTLLVSD